MHTKLTHPLDRQLAQQQTYRGAIQGVISHFTVLLNSPQRNLMYSSPSPGRCNYNVNFSLKPIDLCVK